MAYIEVKHLYKRYHMGKNVIEANRDVNFEIEKCELVIIWNFRSGRVDAAQRLGRNGRL